MNHTDQQIRRLLTRSLPEVDQQQGWEGVQSHITAARRRRWATVLTSVAAVVAVVTFGWFVATNRPPSPGVASSPTTTISPPPADCPTDKLSDQDVAYLQRWTDIESPLAPPCLLQGLVGPAPKFDTSVLGNELPLHPRLVAGASPPTSGSFKALDGYPIVHIGQVDQTDMHGFLYWVADPAKAAPVPRIGGSVGDPVQAMASQPGIQSVGTSGAGLTIYVVVPETASITALTINGQPIAFQRPVAKVNLFFVDRSRINQASDITVTVYDNTGQNIDQYKQTVGQ